MQKNKIVMSIGHLVYGLWIVYDMMVYDRRSMAYERINQCSLSYGLLSPARQGSWLCLSTALSDHGRRDASSSEAN